MKKIYCDVLNKYFYDDEPCIYEQRKVADPSKVCVKCFQYKSLHRKPVKKEAPVEKAIRQFCKATNTPKGNVEFYLHIYKKINEARENSKLLTKSLQTLIKNQAKLLYKTLNDGWLQKDEASFLWQNWLSRIGNKDRLSMKILEDHFVRKDRKRTNLALEFLSRALVNDAEEFGGKPYYKEVSKLLSSIMKKEGGHSYTVNTLKGKYPILKIPGLKFDQPIKEFPKLELILNLLPITEYYFETKGERFLPNPLPTNPKGYIKSIIEILDASHEVLKMPKHPGIPIPIPKK